MTVSRCALVALVAACFAAGAASAGPFGLEMGMSAQQIGGDLNEFSPGRYEGTQVPKPHSAFETYMFRIGPKSGLCFVKALGKDIRTSGFGLELRGAYDDMKARLSAAYGKSRRVDRLLPTSGWTEPRDWTMGIAKRERVLADVWSKESGASLPADVRSVALAAAAWNATTGYLIVDYKFVNDEQCEREIADMEDGAL